MTEPKPHYPTRGARNADFIVHMVGLGFALFGGGVLLGLSVGLGRLGQVAAVGVYACGLLLMLALSTAYNFVNGGGRPVLRRLDHAGIFVMIAGSYTPFTTHSLSGAWAWGMTSAVWALAALGVAGKLLLPGLGRRFWIGLYIALGWIVLVALRPIARAMPAAVLILLAVGGLLYTSGVAFYVNKRLRFSRAIWHGHVIAAAAAHWTAVLLGLVLVDAH